MNHDRDEYPEAALLFLQTMLETNATIAGAVVEITDDTWAIHGAIPVDGEVIMAEFTTYDHARIVLDQLATEPRSPRPPGQEVPDA